MIRPLLGFAAAGYLLWRWTNPVPTDDRRGIPKPVETWESEGGALPEQPAVPGQREHREVPA